jgi:hypothetical protein
MVNRFSSLPQSASRAAICDLAGKLFQGQRAADRLTDWRNPEHVDKAIYYIAEDAHNYRFSAFSGMTQEAVASVIGNAIWRYINGQR